MNNKLITVLLAACLPLTLIIIGEWFYALHVRDAALTPAPKTSKAASPTEMPSLDLSGLTEESYQQLVNRPLFIKGRRPVEEPTIEQTQAGAIQANFDWQLNGIYSTPKGQSALFSRITTKIPKDNFRRIGLGSNLDGWKLEEIASDKVILSLGSGKKELPLRKAKPKNPVDPKSKLNQPAPQPRDAQSPQPIPAIPIEPELEPVDESTEDSLENGPND
jgi:hypothetical protein